MGTKRVETRDREAQQVRRAAALTAELAAQSKKKTAAVCDQPPGLDELAGHTEAPNMGAGGSHPKATVMPDLRATGSRPSASENQAVTSVLSDKETFAPTGGFRRVRTRSRKRRGNSSRDNRVSGQERGLSLRKSSDEK